MTEAIVKSLIQGVVTADLGKLVETLLALAYSAQHCREKSKTLALKVSLIGKSVAELVEKKTHFDKENVERLEAVFNDAIYLLRKYRNRSIFIKIFKAPFSEDGFDSIHKRLDIIVEYFGFNLQVGNDSKVSELVQDNQEMRSMIQRLIQGQKVEMSRLLEGDLRSEEKDEVNYMVNGIVLEGGEFYDEHVLFASFKHQQDQQGADDSPTKVLLMYSDKLEERELAILKQLSKSHTNILQFFGTYTNGNTKYAVMERPGEKISTLDEFIENTEFKNGHWSLKKNLALEIAMGLQYAHTVGVVHKNLRSPNIFIDDSQELHPKIFGFNQGRIEALKSEKKPQSKEQVRWKAPEMLPQSKSSKDRPEYSFECDIFSLGVVFWEIITWSFPFGQLKGVRKVLQARTKQGEELEFSVLPQETRSASLQMFVRISEDCMERDPGKRPSIDEVVERLSQLLPENMS